MENIFLQDPNAAVFGEFSALSIGPGKTSLQDREKVVSAVMALKCRYVVIRPLFESDRIEELLNWFPSSSVIWLFRQGDEVVRSMIRKWGSDFFEISRQVEQDQDGHWRLDSMVQEIMAAYQTPEDRYCAYWLARNGIVLDLSKETQGKVRAMDYATFTSDPYTILSKEVERHTSQALNVPSYFRYAVREPRIFAPLRSVAPALRNAMESYYQKLSQLEP